MIHMVNMEHFKRECGALFMCLVHLKISWNIYSEQGLLRNSNRRALNECGTLKVNAMH